MVGYSKCGGRLRLRSARQIRGRMPYVLVLCLRYLTYIPTSIQGFGFIVRTSVIVALQGSICFHNIFILIPDLDISIILHAGIAHSQFNIHATPVTLAVRHVAVTRIDCRV